MTAANVVAFPKAPPSDELVLIRPGVYTATYITHEGLQIFNTKKVKVTFQLLEHCEIYLPRWYRVASYKGRVAASSKSSDIVREISEVLGARIRRDQVPVASLKGLIVQVEVSTVVRDSRPSPLAEVNQYSVIERVRCLA